MASGINPVLRSFFTGQQLRRQRTRDVQDEEQRKLDNERASKVLQMRERELNLDAQQVENALAASQIAQRQAIEQEKQRLLTGEAPSRGIERQEVGLETGASGPGITEQMLFDVVSPEGVSNLGGDVNIPQEEAIAGLESISRARQDQLGLAEELRRAQFAPEAELRSTLKQIDVFQKQLEQQGRREEARAMALFREDLIRSRPQRSLSLQIQDMPIENRAVMGEQFFRGTGGDFNAIKDRSIATSLAREFGNSVGISNAVPIPSRQAEKAEALSKVAEIPNRMVDIFNRFPDKFPESLPEAALIRGKEGILDFFGLSEVGIELENLYADAARLAELAGESGRKTEGDVQRAIAQMLRTGIRSQDFRKRLNVLQTRINQSREIVLRGVPKKQQQSVYPQLFELKQPGQFQKKSQALINMERKLGLQ